MFKIKNKILPLAFTPNAKLKQKIWGISSLLLFSSLFLIDVINARTGSHLNGMFILIYNIPLIIPWGIAYLIAPRQKDWLKMYAPLYVSLVLLITIVGLAFNQFIQSQHFEKKFDKEMAKILNDYADFLGDTESSSQNQSRTYSADEYGQFALYLNKFKKLMELSKQENRAVVQAFNEIELDKIFTDEVLFNFFNITEKKKKLERLSLFLDESAKRAEGTYSEYVTWVLSSPEVDEGSRQNFAKAISTSSEEKRFLRQEPYRIKKNIIREYIKFLDFLSKAYGSYGKEGAQIVFTNDSDLQAWRSHCEMIEKLFKEEEKFAVIFQEGARRMAKPTLLMNKTSDDSDPAPTEYSQRVRVSNPIEQILVFFQQELINMDRAFTEVDLNSICTEEVFFDIAKINEKKKKLRQISIVLDALENKLDKQVSDLLQQRFSSVDLSDQSSKTVEIFKTMPTAIKRWIAAKRKCVLEFIKLLDFLSIRHGTYKLAKNGGLYFPYEIETKLCASHLNNINKFFKEEEEIASLIQRCTHELSK